VGCGGPSGVRQLDSIPGVANGARGGRTPPPGCHSQPRHRPAANALPQAPLRRHRDQPSHALPSKRRTLLGPASPEQRHHPSAPLPSDKRDPGRNRVRDPTSHPPIGDLAHRVTQSPSQGLSGCTPSVNRMIWPNTTAPCGRAFSNPTRLSAHLRVDAKGLSTASVRSCHVRKSVARGPSPSSGTRCVRSGWNSEGSQVAWWNAYGRSVLPGLFGQLGEEGIGTLEAIRAAAAAHIERDFVATWPHLPSRAAAGHHRSGNPGQSADSRPKACAPTPGNGLRQGVKKIPATPWLETHQTGRPIGKPTRKGCRAQRHPRLVTGEQRTSNQHRDCRQGACWDEHLS